MKKTLFFKIGISTAALLVVFSLIVSSCNFKFGDPSLLTEPTVDYSSSILTISIPRQSKSTKYINIYRQDLSGKKSADYDEAEILSIGVIFPSNLKSGGSTYQFQDTMVCYNHIYRYSVRYCEKKGFYYSEWSNTIEVDNKSTFAEELEDSDLTYSIKDAMFYYDITDDSFTLSGSVIPPEAYPNFADYFDPALLVEYEDDAKVFQLPNSVISKIKEGSSDEVKFSIKNIISSDFYDKEITIKGILGQHKQTASESVSETESTETSTDATESEESESSQTNTEDLEEPIQRIIWTKPVSIPISQSPTATITIPSGTATDGFDYSRSLSK